MCICLLLVFVRAGIIPLIGGVEIDSPFFMTTAPAEYVQDLTGSTLSIITIIVAKRGLISSTCPVNISDLPLPPKLLRTTLHSEIDGVLQATSHVNSSVLLFILLHVASYKY